MKDASKHHSEKLITKEDADRLVADFRDAIDTVLARLPDQVADLAATKPPGELAQILCDHAKAELQKLLAEHRARLEKIPPAAGTTH